MKEYMITHTYKDYYFVYADSGDEALELYWNGFDKEGKEIEIKNSEGIETVVTEYKDLDPATKILQAPNRALEYIEMEEE